MPTDTESVKLPFSKGDEPGTPLQGDSVSDLSETDRKFEPPPPTENFQVVAGHPQGNSGNLPMQADLNTGQQIVRTLSQVMNTPKIEYMHFGGNPIDYVSFMRNFETCLEDHTDGSRSLQLLIQHCTGKAREAIESCVNLPVSEGYESAKKTLKENFGLPHVIAKAHLKKLEQLQPLKASTGSALLEFSRSLEIAERTLKGMGPEYVSDLNHTNTLMELNRKLPYFMRAK